MEGDGGLKYWSQEGKQGRQSNLTVVLLEIEKQLFWLHKSIEFQIIDPVLNNLVQVSNGRNSQYVQTKYDSICFYCRNSKYPTCMFSKY